MSFMASAVFLSWLILVGLIFAMAGLLRKVADLNQRIAPRFVSTGPAPNTHIEARFLDRAWLGNTLLLFSDGGCISCLDTALAAARIAREHADELRVILLIRGQTPSFRRTLEEAGALNAGMRVVDDAEESFRSLNVELTPFAVAADSRGIVLAAAPVGSARALQELAQNMIPHEEDRGAPASR